MIEAAEISKLSKAERLRVMDLIWESLVNESEEPESPDWHGEVVAERMEKVESGDAKFLSLDEVKDRLNIKT